MNNIETLQNKKKGIGGGCYLNKNCWLVQNLNSSPYKRCQYCELKFHKCLFLQYQVISGVLILFSFLLFFLIEKKISTSAIIVIFTFIIVYGYFFNNSTEKIIKANFFEKKAKESLRELSDKLEERVADQTSDIKEKNQHLEELLNMKSDFLRTVNHQLNTPLSIMRNACSMMQDGSLPFRQGMEIASSGLERMSSTISEFWDAFELEGQKIVMNLVSVDIEKIVKEMIEEKKNLKLAISRKLKIKLNKANFSIPSVLCDQKKITHVISNLLDNAVFYTQKGSVTVYFEKIKRNKKEYLKVLISDTGAGISKEDQKKLFKKFSRGSVATSLHPDGSGLGLYIAKNIIEDSGGELKLEKSEMGKGTTFSFVLQVSKCDDKKENIVSVDAKQEGVELKNKKLDKYSVLFIEDEKSIVDLYKIYFEKHKYKFYSTYDLKEAKNILKSKNIDVIVLDIIIRKKENNGMINVVAEQGYEFLKYMKKDESITDIPVIVFTNLNTDKDREMSKKLGASSYLFKGSAKPEDLIGEIERVVVG